MSDDLSVSNAIDEINRLISYVSYRSFLAGVRWGAHNGLGEYDDADRAWADIYGEDL